MYPNYVFTTEKKKEKKRKKKEKKKKKSNSSDTFVKIQANPNYSSGTFIKKYWLT